MHIIMLMIKISKVILVVHKLAISIIYIAKMEERNLKQKKKMYIKCKQVKIRTMPMYR